MAQVTPETFRCLPEGEGGLPEAALLQTGSGSAYTSIVLRFPRASGIDGIGTALSQGDSEHGEAITEQYMGDVDVAFSALALDHLGAPIRRQHMGRLHPVVLPLRLTSPAAPGSGWATSSAAMLRFFPDSDKVIAFEEAAIWIRAHRIVEGVVRLSEPLSEPLATELRGVATQEEIRQREVPSAWSDQEVAALRGLLWVGGLDGVLTRAAAISDLERRMVESAQRQAEKAG